MVKAGAAGGGTLGTQTLVQIRALVLGNRVAVLGHGLTAPEVTIGLVTVTDVRKIRCLHLLQGQQAQ